ncbi:MAG TPA: alpha-L-glutamate ligase-like protein [Woeseiaceae bacterium]|nr:alpha-L-glutamate ligase-like protein [Woeseiaceae bacterium]
MSAGWLFNPRERARALRAAGVLGLNQRNARYIAENNQRRFYPRVDDKVLTKKLAIEAGMAVPELYGVIDNQGDTGRIPEIVADHQSFVVKPAHGSGGDGIVVVSGRRRDRYRLIDGQIWDGDTLEFHVSNIVGGQYSLTGEPDTALIEYCVQFDPLFEQVSFQGVPDVRVITYRGYPVMAMVRLPTKASHGKANLHQGAVGAGIDMAGGVTLDGVSGNELVEEHPDTYHPIAGLRIPEWDFILTSAARAIDVTGLGYVGVDMVLDRDLGPLILEMNARPGLNIQLANRAGLRPRLEAVDREYDAAATPEQRAGFARGRFPAHPSG